MAFNPTPAVRLNPSVTKTPTPQNYLSISDMNYLRNELPAFISKTIFQRYGSQELDTFIERKGLKMALASDVATWMEEDRLTQLATGVTRVANVFTSAGHTFRVGEILTAFDATGAVLVKGRINAVTSNTFTADGSATSWASLGTTALICYTGTSEFNKGTAGMQESLNTTYQQYSVKPTIVKDMVSDNRTNLTQDSWISVKAPNGTVGNLWYDVNKNGCEARFRNAREKSHFDSEVWTGDLLAAGYTGREGLLAAMSQGNVYAGNIASLANAQSIVNKLEKQGQITDNTIYGTTDFNFAIDSMLAAQNVNGQAFGSFDNAENMELNLSFKGFAVGGYNFNYSSLRYLNDPIGHGARVGVTKTNGFMFPNASQSVRDTNAGKQSLKPVLHVLYRAKGGLNRDYEMVVRDWAQGTSLTDTVTTEFQSEQATCLLGRNNTILFQG